MPLRRLLPLVTALAISALPTMAAPPLPDGSRSLAFDIIRHGETIGSHSLVFNQRQGMTEVRIDVSVKVTVLSFTAYRFEQHGTEVWVGNRLKTLAIDSDDNGSRHRVVADLVHGKLRTVVDGNTADYPEMPPATLWRAVPAATTVVLDPTDGRPTFISTTDAGWETISVRGQPTRARHWTWDGELKRDLWYDGNDTLVQVRVMGDDGSEVIYVLR
ncbi:MAG: hypothetical protein EPN20_14655 [Magnetospirillum sp.]|nr:MAG: hypothetical protein EPN20_14655 [Magnetospirillum sp.]